MVSKPYEFLQFTKIDKSVIDSLLRKIKFYLSDLIEKMGISGISARESAIYQIFEEIEKQRVYFHVFHNGYTISKLDESVLMCFWIIKLQPFFLLDNKIPSNELNSKIA